MYSTDLPQAQACRPDRLGDEGFADAGLADQEQRTRIVQPSERVELLDFRLGDRALAVKSKSSNAGRRVNLAALMRLPVFRSWR